MVVNNPKIFIIRIVRRFGSLCKINTLISVAVGNHFNIALAHFHSFNGGVLDAKFIPFPFNGSFMLIFLREVILGLSLPYLD